MEKRGRGRPRRPAQIVISEMVEEDVFHTPIVQSAFSYSPKEVGKYKDKGKSITNSISISEPTENNENNDSEKTKKSGKEVFPCGVCEGNVGVNSNKCWFTNTICFAFTFILMFSHLFWTVAEG